MGNEIEKYLELLKDPYNPIYLSIFFVFLLFIMFYIIYMKILIPINKKHEEQKKKIEMENLRRIIESEKKYKALALYLQDHLESERQRIGLELHDSIAQNIYAIRMMLNNAAHSNELKDKLPESISKIFETIDLTITDLKEIMYNLRPKIIDDFGLMPAVQLITDTISKNFDLKANLDCVGTPIKMDKKVELYTFRIIQEALNNILRHSKATEYYITICYLPKDLKIIISDNGIGFDTEKITSFKSYGILNMSERVKTLNGKIKITSSDSEGTNLFIEIPYKHE